MSNNEVEQLEGFLGADPTWIEPIGKPGFVKFRLATTQWVLEGGVRQKRTDWYTVVCFDFEMANDVRYSFKKGNKVCVKGNITTKPYVDKDGVSRQATSVIARSLRLIPRKVESLSDEPETMSVKPALLFAKKFVAGLFGRRKASVGL